MDATPGSLAKLNDVTVNYANRWVYSSDKKVILKSFNANPLHNENDFLNLEPYDIKFPDSSVLRAHEFLWHHLVSALKYGPTSKEAIWDFELNFEEIKRDWNPGIIFPANVPAFPPGLVRDQDIIIACMYEIPGVTSERG